MTKLVLPGLRPLQFLLSHPLHIAIGSWYLSRRIQGHVLWSGEWPFPRLRIAPGGQLLSGGALLGGGVHIEVGPDGVLELGAGAFINRGSTIICRDEVRVGRGARLAWNVTVMDSDEHEHAVVRRGPAPIRIGHEAWICAQSVVLKGVRIGDRAVVGAGSVVTRDVADDSLVTGTAAGLRRAPP